MVDKKQVISAFHAYVEQYDTTDERIQLKISHTLRVANLCEKIAKSLAFSKEDTLLAWSIGILHDIGRFEQLKRYHTFVDAISINHAQFGIDLLFKEGMIHDFIEPNEEEALIKVAIEYHNLYRLPEGLSERETVFCNLIRDADKIDIFKVISQTPITVIYECTETDLKSSVITEKVMRSYFEHHAVNHQLKVSPVDYIVGHASLAFELVYPVSLEITQEQGNLAKILSFESDNDTTREQFQKIREEMDAYLNGRV